MSEGGAFHLRNVILFLGVIITTVGLIYFATAFSDLISDWGRVASLVLLTVIYVSLGLHFAQNVDDDALIDRPGWKWVRVATALYILGLVAAFSAVISFLVIDELSRITKVIVTILFGLFLIVYAASRFQGKRKDERAQ